GLRARYLRGPGGGREPDELQLAVDGREKGHAAVAVGLGPGKQADHVPLARRHLDLGLLTFPESVEEYRGWQHRYVAEAIAVARVLEEERGEQEPRRELALGHRTPEGGFEVLALRGQVDGRQMGRGAPADHGLPLEHLPLQIGREALRWHAGLAPEQRDDP